MVFLVLGSVPPLAQGVAHVAKVQSSRVLCCSDERETSRDSDVTALRVIFRAADQLGTMEHLSARVAPMN